MTVSADESGKGVNASDINRVGLDSDQLILVAGDGGNSVSTLVRYLEVLYPTVVVAADGYEALRLMSRRKPALVCVGVDTAKIDAYTLTALMRHNNQLKDVPVMVYGAEDDLFSRARAKIFGCDALLPLKFSENRLAELTRRLIAL